MKQLQLMTGVMNDSKAGVVALAVERLYNSLVHVKIKEAEDHHPDCQCSICVHGADAWLRQNHPSEY